MDKKMSIPSLASGVEILKSIDGFWLPLPGNTSIYVLKSQRLIHNIFLKLSECLSWGSSKPKVWLAVRVSQTTISPIKAFTEGVKMYLMTTAHLFACF
jgi:hypothetical protein